ncbi:MAG: 1-acyl-sn-glycerol-3-phosphate acyltransferase [Bacteroidales bacterium]|nr:1-acyl-sn-glycerol-3-phosphate acyltransferase [Bacteroidales bacterium]
MKDTKFDDIRPYYEEEIPAAMHRIADCNIFPIVASFVFPGREVEEIRAMVRSFTTTDEFQKIVMYKAHEEIIKNSTQGFTVTGLEKLDKDKPYLFVSNHRDIVLDASLLQKALVDHGMETSEITFGANLMTTQLVVDIGKSNKMFRVERGGNPREFYLSSVHLSEYIRHAITEKKQSVWIAQRNGRTKDGNDQTDQGIVKMFGLSRPDDKIESLAELNIVPVAVSYEWEPCDILKVLELYESSKRAYTKKPGEDLNSIITGIMAPKGHVHFSVCDPLGREDLLRYDGLTSSSFNREIAALMDQRIYAGYHLYPNNWIAHDIRYGQKLHSDRYTPQQKAAFREHLAKLMKYDSYELETLRDLLLAIYSNPVDNCMKYNN